MAKKKKIGIVTFWQSNDNYGQQLQLWALQKVLKNNGYAPFLIRFAFLLPPISNCSQLKYIKRWIKREIRPLRDRTNIKNVLTRHFPLFRLLHINQTYRVYRSISTLKKYAPMADVYITGSDQVWNYHLGDELSVSFLQFGAKDVKRIAYGPSIGYTSYPAELSHLLKQYLQDFAAISVRERSAVGIMSDFGFKAQAVLDPTMLLSADNYLHLLSPACSERSVFIYSLNYNSVDDVPYGDLRAFAEKHSVPIFVTPSSGYLPARELFDDAQYRYATIPKWISLIAGAELVVTASFHGIIFAILLHRPFLFTPLDGEYTQSNRRVLDLLPLLGLEHRVWDKSKSVTDILNAEIDWKFVDFQLQKLRKQSMDYLLNAIEK